MTKIEADRLRVDDPVTGQRGRRGLVESRVKAIEDATSELSERLDDLRRELARIDQETLS